MAVNVCVAESYHGSFFSSHIPGGTKELPVQSNFLRKGDKRAAQMQCGSERPLRKTGKLHDLWPLHPGMDVQFPCAAGAITSLLRRWRTFCHHAQSMTAPTTVSSFAGIEENVHGVRTQWALRRAFGQHD